MLAMVLALGSSCGWGSADFLGGLSAKRVPILVVAAVSQAVGFAFTLLVVLAVHRGPLDVSVLWIGAIAGVLGAGGLSALYQGLAVGRMGVVAPIAALSGVVPVVVGLVAQGDRPEAVQVVGMVLAIGGVVMASRARDEAAPGRRLATGAGLALLAALLLGAMVVALDAGGDRDPVWTVFMVRVSSVAAALAGRGGAASLLLRRCGRTSRRWWAPACSTTSRTCSSCWRPREACSASSRCWARCTRS